MTAKDLKGQYEKAKAELTAYLTTLHNEDKIQFIGPHTSHLAYMYRENFKHFLAIMCMEASVYFMDGIQKIFEITDDCSCSMCDSLVTYRFEAGVFTALNTDCYEEREIRVEINVPSGKLMLVDWPMFGNEMLGHLDERKFSLNSQKGTDTRSLAYASENVLHFYVGNTCPSIYYNNNTVCIGVAEILDDDDDEIPLITNGEYVGHVCTDLWWVTGVDFNQYKDLVRKKLGPNSVKLLLEGCLKNENDYGVHVFDVTPGTYICTSNNKNGSMITMSFKK